MTKDLFARETPPPLAARMRPGTLDEILGQEHLLGPQGLLRKTLKHGRLFSAVLWGPPGSGKTTIARLLAKEAGLPFQNLNAVSSGVADLRKVIQASSPATPILLFIDELHRFNKSQQAALLDPVENGSLVLVGATTENPGFEVIPPLLSRCQVWRLEPLRDELLEQLLEKALTQDPVLASRKVQVEPGARRIMVQQAAGDARRLLTFLELAVSSTEPGQNLDEKKVADLATANALPHDKQGDRHYDTISAFIKAVRGSDPDAAVYYLARMLEAGENPLFIARRLLILASEDLGNAAPNALLLAEAAFNAVTHLGMPEAGYALAQVTIYLAASPKSNSAATALLKARKFVRENPGGEIPLHLRNAANSLVEKFGHGSAYKYPHDFPGHYVPQQYLPDQFRGVRFYIPTDQGLEYKLKEYLKRLENQAR
jgi:putative ATPase